MGVTDTDPLHSAESAFNQPGYNKYHVHLDDL